ncbi:MAG: peptidase M50 [Oscillospiraceae bacterium]|nr:peptidase M50 [Oscillospiraceae bacterium]
MTWNPEKGLCLGRVEVGGGLLFWLALLWYLGYDLLLGCFLMAAALHELGHALAVWQCGGRIRRLRLNLLGAELELDGRERLSYGQEVWVAAAGPLVNLGLGVAAARLWQSAGWDGALMFAGASLVLGCFNLLPLDPLDGGQMLRSAVAWLWTAEAAEAVTGGVSWLIALALLAAGVWLLWRTRYNVTLLGVALWSLLFLKEKKQKNFKRRF